MIINFIRGFCMALADSVPGVSGGTVAFLLGFYDKFIGSLNSLTTRSLSDKKDALLFLLKLGVGWIVGFILAIDILAKVFDVRIYEVSSLFLGFILFAIPVVIKEEKDVFIFNRYTVISAFVGILLVAFLTYFNPTSGQDSTFDLLHLDIGSIAYIIIAGMFAIAAMILPGISGSTLLLIFGLYIPLVHAVSSTIHGDFSYIPAMLIFICGIILGLATVVRFVHVALIKHRSIMVFFIIGMMIGSFYAIVMGPTTLAEPKEMMTLDTFSVLWFLIGGALIYGLQYLKKVIDK